MRIIKTISEAPESNAGDDFHIKWAVHKCLDLLSFEDNCIKAVTIEGPSPEESNKIDSSGEKLLAIDIAEYYGHSTFARSNQVVFSQLKYSTRRPEENWILSKLCRGKKSKNKGSIINKLATVFTTYYKEYGADIVVSKLKIKLVSNKNIDPKFLACIQEIQSYLIENKKKTYFTSLCKRYPKYSRNLEALFAAAAIKSVEFCDFLKVLNFDDCGTYSRFALEQKTIETISSIGDSEVEDQYNRLCKLVNDKTLPESRENRSISREDVLLCFRFGSIDSLFPVPEQLERKNVAVKRNQLVNISQQILQYEKGPICLHGGAGLGKSTIAKTIKQYLPANSVVLIFDCYGGGMYLDPSDKRHKHAWALLQLSNELALQTGAPFLLSKTLSDEEYLRAFKKRLELSVQIIKNLEPQAIVCIIVDAADNSISASNQQQDKSFVQDLVKVILPHGCKLVVTTRSHRISSLHLPSTYLDIPILPFSIEETKQHISSFFSNISNEETAEFHRLTHGIPRVQAYAIGDKDKDINSVLEPLRPAGKIVEDLIEQQIGLAISKHGSEQLILSILKFLIVLPRPIPLEYLESLANVQREILLDLGTDLWHGLFLNNGVFSFRDEDFETYLRQHYPPTVDNTEALAELFLLKANEDEYASIHLGHILTHCKKYHCLIDIVLNASYLNKPVDPILNKEVYIERTRLAMKNAAANSDRCTYVKLQLIAAETAKTNKILNEVLLSHAELATQYGELSSIQKLYSQSEKESWYGPVHLKSAAVYSRTNYTAQLAKKHLLSAESWISWRARQERLELHNYVISSEDIAFGAEAYIRLRGVKEAIKWLKRWQPKELIFDIVDQLIKNLVTHTDRKTLNNWLSQENLRSDILLQIGVSLNECGIDSQFDHISRIFVRCINKGIVFKATLHRQTIHFCENLSKTDDNRSAINCILSHFQPNAPETLPSFFSNYQNEQGHLDFYFRYLTLKAALEDKHLTVEDFYPTKLKSGAVKSDSPQEKEITEKKSEFNKLYKHLAPLYSLHATFLFKHISEEAFLKDFSKILSNVSSDWELGYYRSNKREIFNFLASKFIGVIIHLKDQTSYINKIKELLSFNTNPISIRLRILDAISLFRKLDSYSLTLLDEVDKLIEEHPLSGSDKIDFYVDSAIIGNRIGKAVGKHYFDKIVSASSEIDILAFEQIKSVAELSKIQFKQSNPKTAFELSRFVEYSAELLHGWDNFPWDDAFDALTNIDIGSSYAILCRWDHRKVIKMQEYFYPILKKSIENGYISHVVASSFLPFLYKNPDETASLLEIILPLFDIQNHSLKNKLLSWLIEDIKTNYSTDNQISIIELIHPHFRNGKFIKKELKSDFEQHRDFINSCFPKNSENEKKYKSPFQIKVDAIDVDVLIQNTNPGDTRQIELLLKSIEAVNEEYYIQDIIAKALSRIAELCPPDQYIANIEALVSVDPEILSYWNLEKALQERIPIWAHHPDVRSWAKQSFARVLKTLFPHFIRYSDQVEILTIKRLATLFGADEIILGEAIVNILPEYLDNLSAAGLYHCISLTKYSLSHEQAEEIVNWTLERWNKKVKLEHGDGIWQEKFNIPANSNVVIARTLRYVLGHPYKDIRWKGAHVIRQLSNYDDTAIVSQLLKMQNEDNNHCFQNFNYTYFWISAKLWLWVTLHRIALENPNCLLPFAKQFYKECTCDILPHALIKQFNINTCLSLNKLISGTYNDAEIESLGSLLKSKVTSPNTPDNTNRDRNQYDFRFHFDFMDTIPYWYERLGTIFDVSSYDVAEIADEFICEKWGFAGDIYKQDHVKYDKYHSITNRHGSIPEIENLEKYLEFHGMFCAANTLLHTAPMKDTTEDHYDRWESWLERWSTTWPNKWLSDMRDSRPPEKQFWQVPQNEKNKKWASVSTDSEFDSLVFSEQTKMIVGYGHFSFHYGKAYKTCSVYSTLVPTKTSRALLRALNSMPSHRDYKIPYEEGDDDDTEDWENPKFVMKGWLKEIENGEKGIDAHDPYSGKIYKSAIVPGDIVNRFKPLITSDDFRTSFFEKQLISKFENWDDVSENPHYQESHGNKGLRYAIDLQFLLDLLGHLDQSLVIECSIMKRSNELKYDYKEHVKLYLIHPNGKIESIRRGTEIG